jgi:hypothetical protein
MGIEQLIYRGNEKFKIDKIFSMVNYLDRDKSLLYKPSGVITAGHFGAMSR